MAMTNHVWPFARLHDGVVEVDQGTVSIGPLADRFSATARKLFPDLTAASVGMSPGHENLIWQRMPAPIMVLGCGAAAASTQSMLLPAMRLQSVSLGDLIPQLTVAHSVSLEIPPQRHQRCSLGPGDAHDLPSWLIRCISTVSNQLTGGIVERTAVAAGLHLLYDDLDGSHALSQTIEGRGRNRNGDYWHAIMHRREPDYGNAQYWFRRVGSHPVMAELPNVWDRVRCEIPSATLDEWSARLVKNGRWDALTFVNACEAAADHAADIPFRRALEEIQHFEMLHLLVQSCADAVL